jgi:hypothetical protein
LRIRSIFVYSLATLLSIAIACKPAESVHPTETTATTATTDTTGTGPKTVTKPQECPPDGTCPGSACPDAITAAAATIPATACPREGEFQSDVDTFSWNEFIALNWPANLANCSANTARSILNVQSGDGTVAVWQTYMPSSSVFVASGGQPAAWCSGNGLATAGARPIDDVAKAEPHFAKLGAMFAQISEPTDDLQAAGGVLTDQSGRWLRYEKLMNQDEYNYTIQNKLWSKAGQTAFKNAGNTAINLPTGPTGAIEIKASWKVLTPAEISGKRYFTTTATVYNTPNNDPSPGKNPVTLGLVGLHIIHKTPQQTGFFWSTFEHVDNDTVFAGGSGGQNQQTAKKPYMELKADGTPNNSPVNVKRLHDSFLDPEINQYYQSLLAGSVFANYRLISTQWQTGGAPQGTPPFVANITMETYVQNLQVGKASGCLACHTTTGTAVAGLGGDHSFLFGNAQ